MPAVALAVQAAAAYSCSYGLVLDHEWDQKPVYLVLPTSIPVPELQEATVQFLLRSLVQ